MASATLIPLSEYLNTSTRISATHPLLTGEFTVPGDPIRIALAEVFAKLDKTLTPR